MKPLKVFALALLFCATAGADGIPLTSSIEEQASFISLQAEMASFSLPAGDLSGYGAKLTFDHYFSPKISVDVYFSTAFGNDGGVQASFTGFGGYLNYAVLGHCCSAQRTINVGGFPAISEKTSLENLLTVGVGVDQFFLNGSQTVYPSSGVGAGVAYDFGAFSYRFRVAARTSMMTTNKMKTTGLFYGAGILFPL